MAEESRDERLDRELEELLQELRVALPGVQILFAFLLIVPFNNRFSDVTELQRDFYLASLVCALAAVTALIAPTAYHRVRFRDYDKERLLRFSTWAARVGLLFLALALAAGTFFVTDFVFAIRVASIVAGAGAAALLVLWFGVPLFFKLRDERT